MSLKVFSLQNNTPEEALAGMRRLIDIDHVFLVRDCYLQSNLMGPATQYQNAQGVPGVWCYFSEMSQPELAPWNYSPGTSSDSPRPLPVPEMPPVAYAHNECAS